AIALTTDTSFLTANANDFGFEQGFARQIEALGRKGDVLVGISTSGNSKNVLMAMCRAREFGVRTIALTGHPGGELARSAEVTISVPSKIVKHIQESHSATGPLLCLIVEETLFNPVESLANDRPYGESKPATR